jgi:hypothetical protein
MTQNASSFHADIDNENKEKRLKQLKNYYSSISPVINYTDKELVNKFEDEIFNRKSINNQFDLVRDAPLIEVAIRYSLSFLDEFNYPVKLQGLLILDHLLINLTTTQLEDNMRSSLIYESLKRFMHDKEDVTFLKSTIRSMMLLLKRIETKYNTSQHHYQKYSFVLESMLNNCYMTSKNDVKYVYYEEISNCLAQANSDYIGCRSLEKLLTISFEFVEDGVNSTTIFNIDHNSDELVVKSLNLLESIIQFCDKRIHSHGKRIINYLIRLIYSASLSDDYNNSSFESSNKIINQMLNILKILFKNERLRLLNYEEFDQLRNQNENLNKTFLKWIENI